MFSGSYLTTDVEFLLKKIDMASTDVQTKEKLIQKQHSHYSELLTFEKAPSASYMNIFHQALKQNGGRFKNDVMTLAHKIMQDFKDDITIVSLARAGTPVGVLLNRLINETGRKVHHYSVSIIRDRGLDTNAIQHILQHHADSSIVFVDGWTGKGIIGQELKKTIENINVKYNTHICSDLYVIADISGTAYYSATHDDYLLPSAVLNSTISGLVSRTVLNTQYIDENDFHGCVFYDALAEHDISQWFIDYMINLMPTGVSIGIKTKEEATIESQQTLEFFMQYYQLSNINYIKPGVGESTRVLLRRQPKEIWLKDTTLPEVSHLLYLAQEKCVNIRVDPTLSYNAVAIIEELD